MEYVCSSIFRICHRSILHPHSGHPDFWVAVVRPGRVLYEIEGVSEELAREAFLRAHHKLPIKTRFIRRDGGL